MTAPTAVMAIMARITELGQRPAAVDQIVQISQRFQSMLPSFDSSSPIGDGTTNGAVSTTAATTAGATSTTPPPMPQSLAGTMNGLSDAAVPGTFTSQPALITFGRAIDAYGGVDSYTGTTSPLSSSLTSPEITAALAAMPVPTGTWVDRIPNARGKLLAPAIAAAAQKYNLDPALLAAVYWTESSYTPDAVSRTGAIGLGQLMPETAEWLHVDPWNPLQNIDGSARMYRYLLDKQGGNLDLAIASYAAGVGAVQRAGGVPDQFTANYIVKLTGRRDYLNGLRATPP